jgi:hypothetical protein
VGAVNRGGGGHISEFIRNQAKRRIKNGLLCKRCFTNLNWDILFYNSVHYAKTPAMKVRNRRNRITSRDESNSIKGTVVRDGFLA